MSAPCTIQTYKSNVVGCEVQFAIFTIRHQNSTRNATKKEDIDNKWSEIKPATCYSNQWDDAKRFGGTQQQQQQHQKHPKSAIDYYWERHVSLPHATMKRKTEMESITTFICKWTVSMPSTRWYGTLRPNSRLLNFITQFTNGNKRIFKRIDHAKEVEHRQHRRWLQLKLTLGTLKGKQIAFMCTKNCVHQRKNFRSAAGKLARRLWIITLFHAAQEWATLSQSKQIVDRISKKGRIRTTRNEKSRPPFFFLSLNFEPSHARFWIRNWNRYEQKNQICK